jgi:hypothetical protein
MFAFHAHLMACQEIGDAFNVEYIFYLLEEFMFVGPHSLVAQYAHRFGGIYGITAVAYVCTMVSVLCSETPVSHHFQMYCVASCHKTGTKISEDFSYRNFNGVYVRFVRLLAGMWDHPYHGRRLRRRLSEKFAASW